MPERTPTLIFDFADPLAADLAVHRLAFINPDRIIVARTLDEVIPALNVVWAATQQGFYAAGFICYEAAPAFDTALQAHTVNTPNTAPLLWFALFRAPTELSPVAGITPATTCWASSTSREKYDHDIAKIRAAIERGDTYQVNYTMPLHATVSGDNRAWYESLVAQSHGQYNAFVDLGEAQILSLSPELFFAWDGETIVAKPMKGTALRDAEHNMSEALQHSEKDRAENLMIVDLLRNDLARVALTGSVEVPQLFTLETYPTVYQMTSTISAKSKPGINIVDVFRALFPCGSITGAPKIKTTEIIAQREAGPRGIYCGALGFIAPQGHAIFNVPIRTISINAASGVATLGTGGGITWGSNADEEYAEALSKTRFLADGTKHFELLETLLLANNEYAFLERHLARIEAAADHFSFDIKLANIRSALQQHAAQFINQSRRVRLLVSHSAEIKIESVQLQNAAPLWMPYTSAQSPTKIALAKTPVDSHHEFLYYKTTARHIYERHANVDVFDVLLWNERGEITEFTRGNVVVERGGKYLTPPVKCGLLAGVLRAELLDQGVVSEAIIHRAELLDAQTIWFINGVRGWVQVAIKD